LSIPPFKSLYQTQKTDTKAAAFEKFFGYAKEGGRFPNIANEVQEEQVE
jgi:hypothetical protein